MSLGAISRRGREVVGVKAVRGKPSPASAFFAAMLLVCGATTRASAHDGGTLEILREANREGLGSLADFQDGYMQGNPRSRIMAGVAGALVGGRILGGMGGRAFGIPGAVVGGLVGAAVGKKLADEFAVNRALAHGPIADILQRNYNVRQSLTRQLELYIASCVSSRGLTPRECDGTAPALDIHTKIRNENRRDCEQAAPLVRRSILRDWHCD